MIPDEIQYIYRAALKKKVKIHSYYDNDYINIADINYPSSRLWVRFHLYDSISEVIIPCFNLPKIKEIIGVGIINPRVGKLNDYKS